jgi:hypothetical protein
MEYMGIVGYVEILEVVELLVVGRRSATEMAVPTQWSCMQNTQTYS